MMKLKSFGITGSKTLRAKRAREIRKEAMKTGSPFWRTIYRRMKKDYNANRSR